MDEQSVKKLAQLLIDVESVSKDLRQKRTHPLDILPIERPDRLARKLDNAIKDFNNQ